MSEQKLWYRQPAQYWTQALPLGNGRLGAMVFGGVETECLCLNEDTLWSGYPKKKTLPGAWEGWQQAQKLVMEGKTKEASREIEKQVLGEFNDSYLPMGDLLLEFSHSGEATDYTRELDLSTGIARVAYKTPGGVFEREYWISHPAQAMVLHLSAKGEEALTFTARLTCPLHHEFFVQEDVLLLEGLCPSRVEPNYVDSPEPVVYRQEPEKIGVRFRAGLKAQCVGGTVTVTPKGITVSGAREAVLVLGAYSNFNGFENPPELAGKEYQQRLWDCVQKACACSWEELRAAHIADWQELYGRVDVSLRCEHPAAALPTDERLAAFQKDAGDIGLYELLFHYGRYLTIASSRKGTQAANLQGIWNREMRPPWSSNYTTNINAEMNYWPTLVCSLPECYEPLLRLVEEVAQAGAETAREQYHAGGFTAHHNVDLWRSTNSVGNHVEGSCGYGFWPMGAGWLCSHVYEYYRFTMDRVYLRRKALPLLRGCARFYLDVLTEYDGHLLFCPAISPENNYFKNGESNNLSVTTTMTTAIIREVFENYLAACEKLGIREDQTEEVEKALPRLPEFRVGSKGQLLEWYQEEEEVEPHHRHISHLYPFHPASLITMRKDPELSQAVRQSLLLRGDDGTGWSLGWKISQWARLKDGNHAVLLMKNQLRLVKDDAETNYQNHGGTYENLFDAHPPFQIDGNFAFTAGLAELLLQSHDGSIELLPALPDCMPEGQVRGLSARGGAQMDFDWKDGKLLSFTLHGPAGEWFPVRWGEKEWLVQSETKICCE